MQNCNSLKKGSGTHEINQKLLNIVPELPATKIKDVSTFKGIVTGDEISADIKYKSRQTIVPYAKHIFTTNCLPQVNDPTNGFYRRLNIVMFDNEFEVSNNFDINILLQQENLDYLGNIGFQAFLKMLESGKLEFANNVESLELLENYKRINNTILGFLKDEESIELFGTDIKTTEMWRKYKSFCGDNRLEPLPKLQFYEHLVKQFGFVKKLNTGTYYFYRQAPLDDSEFSEVDIEKF